VIYRVQIVEDSDGKDVSREEEDYREIVFYTVCKLLRNKEQAMFLQNGTLFIAKEGGDGGRDVGVKIVRSIMNIEEIIFQCKIVKL